MVESGLPKIIMDYHRLSRLIINYRWLSFIVIDYHWLSLIVIDIHWLSLIIWKFEKSMIHWLTDWLCDSLKSRNASTSKNLEHRTWWQWCFCIQGSKYVGQTAVAAGWGMWESTLISVHQHLLFIIWFPIPSFFLHSSFLSVQHSAFSVGVDTQC